MLGEDEWDDLQPRWSGEELKTESGGESDMPIQKRKKNTLSADRLNTLRTLRQIRDDREIDITPTKIIVTKDESETHKLTESEKMHDIENTTRSTKSISVKSFTPQESDEILPTDSIQLSTDIKRETSDSMNLLKSTSKELFSLMKGLNSRAEDRNPMQLLDPDRVKTAAEVAKQIISCMRTSLDVAKFIKENE